jgi:hypothetical protein
MNSSLNAALASTIIEDRIQSAERERRTRKPLPQADAEPFSCVTVRLANGRDDSALRRLEDLEGRQLPYEPTLVAEVEGQILAARTLVTRSAVADPFRPTQQLTEMLDLRSLQLRQQNGHPVRNARLGRLARTLTPSIRSSSQARRSAQGGPC